MGRLILPDYAAAGTIEVHPAVLVGLHFADGLQHWVPTIVIQSGCIVTEEDGPAVEEWEPATGRTYRWPTIVARHWHTDGTRAADGAWRFRLVPMEDLPSGA